MNNLHNNNTIFKFNIEPFFDGVRKNNARLIFGILISIILLDAIMD